MPIEWPWKTGMPAPSMISTVTGLPWRTLSVTIAELVKVVASLTQWSFR